MQNWASDVLDAIEEMAGLSKFRGIKICKVKSVNPFIFEYKGVELGTTYGDVVYIHPLFLAEPVNFDEKVLADIQNFKSTTAYQSPNFQGIIEGSIPDFIKNFYLFYKEKEKIYLIKKGDMVAIYELGENSYLVLQKVLLDEIKEENEEEEVN